MKITLALGMLLLIICSGLEAQEQLQPEWSIFRPSGLIDGNSEAWAIGSDQDGNLYWGVNQDMPGFLQYMDALVLKLDTSGTIIAADTAVTGQFAQQSFNLKVTDSLIYAAGRTCSSIGTDNCDALFFKNSTITGTTVGDFVWDGGFGYEEIDGIGLDHDGIYLTGWSAGDGTGIDLLLMKLDYSGNIIWQNTWGSPGNRDDHQDGHIVVDASAIYVSGLFNGSPLLGWDGKALLAKFSKADGSLIDSVTFGRNDTWLNAENALGMVSDGEYLYLTGYTTPETSNWDIFVAKFDKSLNQVWYKTWGGPRVESARAIAVSQDGFLYVGGVTKSFNALGEDVALLKFSPDGEVLWAKTWGGTQDDHTLDIHLHNNYLYLTGKTNSFHPKQKWEAMLLKIRVDSATSVNEYFQNSVTHLQVYPNPAHRMATLGFTLAENETVTITLIDLFGKSIETFANQQKLSKGSHELTIRVPSYISAGPYFIRINTAGSVWQVQLMIL